ncbi:early light induced protein-like 3, chloroplast precursor [Micromonas pusilla CCMP1545]|jgi:hypothetical protein|uniref:Early light induced protein-like 3, chloroplast n=1 Tax=Micromonas pusilla (strain CCMP1545) TaxID=564608 RepID=C1MX49_MICPC|nr:early light induced protein-like 3, chloroplast precursor [Micromonas pusilla CCMP1545]EEH55104.1 early light induced protein-like 3, chloroplast precursor [Micromonas pusilla CCMP1545]|eukprot:XP_003060335.1 early light induced protein-like 3, chloroplast precursor [Micromonas pusilla CCMP1545]
MSAFTVAARTTVAARATVASSANRRSVRAAAEPEQKSSGGEVFFTDKNGDGQRATPEEYEAAKAAGNTYQASTVTGDLPEWAAGATADSDISLSLGDAFAFAQVPAATNFVASGPELMNGRLAMIGFVAALGCEIATGETVGQQVAQSPVGVAVVTMLIVGGTLISYCSNTKPPAAGPFNQQKELLNGRAAMVGMASLLAFEAVKGVALF